LAQPSVISRANWQRSLWALIVFAKHHRVETRDGRELFRSAARSVTGEEP
jgi:hypothetical protein